MEDNLNNNSKKEEVSNAGSTSEANNALAKCLKEKDEYLDGWKRAKAELINYKKEEAKRFEMVMKFGQESLIREIVKVLDSFDLALNSLEREGKADKGIYLIRAQLEDILKQSGLERVIINTGEQHDPSLSEVIATVESNKPSGTIIEEVEKGYSLHGKLIRPARVKVSK